MQKKLNYLLMFISKTAGRANEPNGRAAGTPLHHLATALGANGPACRLVLPIPLAGPKALMHHRQQGEHF